AFAIGGLVVVVFAFGIGFQKALKRNDLARSRKRSARLRADANDGRGALNLRVGHL
nr:hypothetical protein [Tanacetum cinerariifolium]